MKTYGLTEKEESRLKELRKLFKPREKAFILCSIDFIPLEEVASILKKPKTKIERYINLMIKSGVKPRIADLFSEKKIKQWNRDKKTRKRKSNKKNVNGIRDDLGIFLRSKIEANLARVLTVKYGKGSWEYEPELFDLGLVYGKPKRYKPDFHVKTKDEDFWIEVKGRFFPGDMTKIKRFISITENKLIIVCFRSSKKVIEFAKKNNIEYWKIEELKDKYYNEVFMWE